MQPPRQGEMSVLRLAAGDATAVPTLPASLSLLSGSLELVRRARHIGHFPKDPRDDEIRLPTLGPRSPDDSRR